MKNKELNATFPIPAEILELFGPPPVLTDQAARVYRLALAQFAQVIRPHDDFIEWTYVRDLADHWSEKTWLRGLMARTIKKPFADCAKGHWSDCEYQIKEFRKKSAAELASKILELGGEPDKIKSETERLKAEAKRANEVQAEKMRRELSQGLQRWDLMQDDVNLYGQWIESYERVEKCYRRAEEKYENTLRRIDEYKHGLGERLRKAANAIIDGEFKEELDPLRSAQAPAADSSVAPATCAEAPLSEHIRPPKPSVTTCAKAPLSEQVPAPEPSVTTCAEAPLSEQIPSPPVSVTTMTCAEAPLSEQVPAPGPSVTTCAEVPHSEQVSTVEPSVTVTTDAEAPLSPDDPAEDR